MDVKYLVEGLNESGDLVSYEVIGGTDEISHLCWCKALIRGISDSYTMTFIEWC